MPGQLFTHYFLTDGIKATAEWKASVARREEFAAFRDGVRQKYETLSHAAAPNEAVTEQDLIRPVLDLLGWADCLPQQGAARNEDIPDPCFLPTPVPNSVLLQKRSLAVATGTRWWCRKANASASLWMPRTTRSRPARRMVRSSGISRPPRPLRMAAFAGAS